MHKALRVLRENCAYPLTCMKHGKTKFRENRLFVKDNCRDTSQQFRRHCLRNLEKFW